MKFVSTNIRYGGPKSVLWDKNRLFQMSTGLARTVVELTRMRLVHWFISFVKLARRVFGRTFVSSRLLSCPFQPSWLLFRHSPSYLVSSAIESCMRLN
jgi:hypothetical protein